MKIGHPAILHRRMLKTPDVHFRDAKAKVTQNRRQLPVIPSTSLFRGPTKQTKDPSSAEFKPGKVSATSIIPRPLIDLSFVEPPLPTQSSEEVCVHSHPLPEEKTNIIYIVLRSHMKRKILEAISNVQAQPAELPSAAIIIGGSTFFSLFPKDTFPLAGIKTEDLDIGVYHPHPSTVAHYDQRSHDYLHDVLSQAIGQTPYEVVKTDQQYAPFLLGSFLLCHKFSPDEMEEAFQRHPELIPYLPQAELEVHLDVEAVFQSAITYAIPPAQQYIPEELQNPDFEIYSNDPRQYMARNLSRTLIHDAFKKTNTHGGFKPETMINIYNLLHANPVLIQDEDVRLIRLLTLVNLAINEKKLDEIDLKKFDPTPENIKAFRDNLAQEISKHALFTDELIKAILKTYQDFIRRVFPVPPQKTEPSLEINDNNEVKGNNGIESEKRATTKMTQESNSKGLWSQFIHWIKGLNNSNQTKTEDSSPSKKEAPVWTLEEIAKATDGNHFTELHLTAKELEFFELALGYRSLPDGGRLYPPPNPQLRIDLLEAEYKDLAEKHPDIFMTIARSPGLNNNMAEIFQKRPI